ncbi:cytochrome P450 [Actinocorallia aurantiaca]|jgi:cytochrome P450|uniref:Cytochrome P450 n=1 Tax=Actinocorallia aurantiaca TaxID=46204 RepID=A0ABN3TY32_9ACTN
MSMTSEMPLPVRRGGLCPFSPAEEFRALRSSEPVCRTTLPGGEPSWVITRYADVRRVLGDTASFSNIAAGQGPMPPPRPESREIPPPQEGFFVAYDPPEHTRLRRMVSSAFTMRRLSRLHSYVDSVVAEHLDAMEAAGPPVDLVQALALPLPSSVISELLGVPHADRAELHRIGAMLFDLTTPPAAQAANFDHVRAFMRDLIAHERAVPGDGLIGMLLREHGEDLSDGEMTGICSLLLVAGYETTAKMIALGVLLLLRHPEQLAILRDRPELTAGAVEEMLRYLSVVHYGFVLTATRDVTIQGCRIRAGDYVMCALPSANRDEALVPDPDRFDVTRRPVPHLAFGYGAHHCVGAALARIELRACLPALFGRFPDLHLAVDPEEVVFETHSAVYGVRSLPVAW